MTELKDFAEAIERRDSAKVDSLVASGGAIDANARLPRFNNPPALVHAARCDCTETVEVLLRAKARIDDTDDDGKTACHIAAISGAADVLAVLVAHGANLGLKDSAGLTALDVCESSAEFANVASLLINAGAPLDNLQTLCHVAVTGAAAIEAMQKRGVVLSQLRTSKGTPLHVAAAAFMPDVAAMRMLATECGVGLEHRNASGLTCMHVGVMSQNARALRVFIECGADVDCRSIRGMTPLHFVRDYDCAIVLLAGGADARARDDCGSTACLLAVGHFGDVREAESIVHALVAANADLDAEDQDGDTARQKLDRHDLIVDADRVDAATRDIAKAQLDLVRHRALQVCIALQSRDLDALQMCEILLHACSGRVALQIPFRSWWRIATTVKHFRKQE